MKKSLERYINSFWLAAIFLLSVSALVYLPLVRNLGYTKDDWYLMYSAHSQGAQFFQQTFQSDRPARAYVMGVAYSLFGDLPLYYHLSGYLWRLLSAIAFLWILRTIWPRQQTATLVMSTFFLIYPGFLSQINPIDYQSQLLALFLAMLSIALTVKTIQTNNLTKKILLIIVSTLLAAFYLSLVEYMIGLEALRLLLITLLVLRDNLQSWRERIMKMARQWIPFLTGPFLFVVWRIFFFHNERRATDLGAQLGQLVGSPIYTGLWWLVYLIQDIIRVIFLAWTVPLYNLAFDLRLRDILIGFGFSVVTLLVVLFSISFFSHKTEQVEPNNSNWRQEALWVGFVSVVAGLIPIIIVNRHADFADYSRYTLASSAGSVMIATALLYYLNNSRLRIAGIGLLTFFAALTHYGNAANLVLETQSNHDFWWQVSWRAPQIAKETTIVANYAVEGIPEDYYVWGPANLIYYSEKSSVIPVPIPISAAVLTDENILQILTGKGQDNQIRRGISSPHDYGNVLVITQATTDGCVRILDGTQPELSSSDTQRIMLISSKSKIKDVLTNTQSSKPPEAIFGSEPQHGWCYYYEKADLAAQQGDWKTVASLGEKALSLGFYPSDSVEWMPFLQAYVKLDDTKKIHPLVSIINANSFLKMEACQILTSTAQTASADMQTLVQESFCK